MNRETVKRVDWGTWVSLAAIVGVCLVIFAKVMPETAVPVVPDENVPPAAQGASDPDAGQPGSAEKSADTSDVKGKEGESADSQTGSQKAEGEEILKQLTGKGPASGYRFSKPDATFTLAVGLAEISGLSVAKDPKVLWAVNDERGMIFRISTTDGSLLEEIEFGKAADYESVEEVDGHVYVGRSDGVLFVIDPENGKSTELDFSATLGSKCDLEGMGFEPAKKRILLACKSASDATRKSANMSFEVHAMDIASRKLQGQPAYVVTAQGIDAYIKAHPEHGELKKLKGKAYAPSGLAVNPQTGEVNIISSAGEIVVVLDANGTIVRIDALDRTVHAQPEGIAFGADGTLFLSNEARGKKPVLHTFRSVAGTGT